MVENRIELKTVGELLEMKFFIPSYQRGYRWTEQQVKDLLNDIEEFRKKKESEHYNNKKHDTDDFYCLQPLVVKESIVEKEAFIKILQNLRETERDILGEVRQTIASNIKWEVIDGQQRLTTLFILLYYLQIDKQNNLFSITYQTRKELKIDEYLNDIDIFNLQICNEDLKDCIDNKFRKLIGQNKKYDNIDFFHILQTLVIIKDWFSKNCEENDEKLKFRNTILNSVKFIWYESVEENPINVFTRINIGKIKLTNAELIKALFLNRSNFKYKDNESLKLRQLEIASEWDGIEYALQNDEFWLFLHEKGYSRPTRIDLIFDLICDQKSLGCYDDIGTDDYKTFRYFYAYFNTLNNDDSSIKKCWRSVKDLYLTFQEWFNNLLLFHYIGYLVEYNYSLTNLITKWKEMTDKESFIKYLKKEIKNVILIEYRISDENYDSDKYESALKQAIEFQYNEDGSNKGKCKPILLFHNIQTIINQNTNNLNNENYNLGLFHKFPFHLYKLENWDVEHINSNITNDEDNPETQKEWLLNVYLSADNETQSKILEYFELINVEDKKSLFNDIKDKFPQPKEWTSEEKNQIWNYTLLDSSTNRSYGNAIFSSKRRIIIGKDKGILIAIPKISKDGKLQLNKNSKAKSSFVPLCTKQVFMKYYSTTMSDANYWTKTIDAESYKNEIEDCLNQLEK